jgi:hypothetical protein
MRPLIRGAFLLVYERNNMTEQLTNEASGEVASVGEPGTSIRGDRIYHNATIYHEDITSVEAIFADMDGQMEADAGQTLSRIVFRGLVSPETIHALSAHPLGNNLEVAQPLEEYGEPGWLVYLAANSPDRGPIIPLAEMVEDTDEYEIPIDFIPRTLPTGYVHRNYIPKESAGQLHNLWKAFDWRLDGVVERAQKIRENIELPATNQRDTWFSGLWAGNILVCAATAERLTYQGANGPFDIVENTEWRTRPDHMRDGLMGHNLWRLNNEILSDLRTNDGATPLIFAECNFMTRADKAGRRAGFRIPSRAYAGQIIVQNVTVNDELEPAGLRDFIFLSLPAHAGEYR